MVVEYYTHPILTKGAPIEVLPLNIAGEKAVARRKLEVKGDMTPADVADVMSLVIFHTLARFVDGLTPDLVDKHLDSSNSKELVDKIVAANGYGVKADGPKAVSAPVA